MHIHLLGYSESTIARILSLLAAKGYTEDVTIVQNMQMPESIPFCPPGITCKKLWWEQWKFQPAQQYCHLAVMKPVSRKNVYDFFAKNCGIRKEHYTSIIHPSSVIDSTVSMESGCTVEPLTVITSFTKLGFGVYINRSCSIGHHIIIGDFVSINPGVHIAGHCSIGQGTQIGIGTIVFDHIKIGSNSIIGGGSVVTKDIPSNVIAWGNPCKVVKNISEA